MRTLYKRWIAGGRLKGEVHCDWIMGRDPNLQKRHKVYAPDPFLVGQERGKSDITQGSQPRQFWNPPRPETPVLYLKAPQSAVADLRQYGIHTGYRRDENSDLDKGLIKIFERNRSDRTKLVKHLAKWIEQLQWEVASDPHLICTVWHPEANLDLVKEAAKGPVYEVTADTVEEALGQLPEDLRRPYRENIARSCIVHLEAPQRVMDELRENGWHNGYWRDKRTGFDNGINELFENGGTEEPLEKQLRSIVSLLQSEAESIPEGVPVIWHPRIDPATLRTATECPVIEITATHTREALDAWEDAKRSLIENLAAAQTVGKK